MQNIQDWLRSEVADVISQGQRGKTKSDYEAQRLGKSGKPESLLATLTRRSKPRVAATWKPICWMRPTDLAPAHQARDGARHIQRIADRLAFRAWNRKRIGISGPRRRAHASMSSGAAYLARPLD